MINFRERAFVLGCLACLLGTQAIAKQPDWAGGPGGNEGGGNPILSFAADSTLHAPGERAQLSWASEGTRFCQASGDWSGKFDTAGAYWTPPLDGPKAFTLKCMAKTGGVEQTVAIDVVAPQPEPTPEPDPTPVPEPDPAPVPEPDPTPIPEPDPAPAPEPDPVPAPTVSFAATLSEIASGGSTTLNWSSTDAESCVAAGGWSGSYAPSGSRVIDTIRSSTSYSITCSGAGGSASASTSVTVVPAPVIALSSSESVVTMGGTTTLSWTTTNADACQATGGWSGSRGPQGQEAVGPIAGATTFTLACTGVGGSAVQMLSVSALGEVLVNWVAPTENVDGSPLTDLASYRIYYGSESRSYSSSIDVTDASATSHAFSAASGDYYVTMTALDASGNESAYANEILRTVP